jgi:beta-glucosidase
MSSEPIDALIAQMTLEEKVDMLGGSDSWHAAGVERLGIPTLKMTDGSAGVRGERFTGQPRSASFPCGTAVGATWDVNIARRIGVALGEETTLKGCQVLLAPTVNMHRTPLAGRNSECFSEDPHLSARMAVASIEGIQSRGVAACVKHFVANDQEFERTTISAEVDERTLREIYLPPFEAAVTEAGAWSVMSSYNRLNGTYTSEHEWLLTTLLREEWAFDGFVVSDWGGTHSTVAAANAGLDCEMPGPPTWRGTKLLDAVRAGEVTEETIDEAVRRMLVVRKRTGVLAPGWTRPEEGEFDNPEHRVLIREAAANAIVLLRNNGILPLDPAGLRKVAVIGPNVAVARIGAGGSPEVRNHPAQSPLAALVERLGEGVEVVYEIGCDIDRDIPRLAIPMTCEVFRDVTFAGEPVARDESDSGGFFWQYGQVPGVSLEEPFSARATGSFVADASGPHVFSLLGYGRARLSVAGRVAIDWGSGPRTQVVELAAGQRVDVIAEFTAPTAHAGGFVVGMRKPQPEDLPARAAEAARAADVAIVVAGMNREHESETFDRVSLDLPGRQNELIAAVVAANPRTIVLVNAGSPVSMPWNDAAAAVAQCWYLGEETGPAIAAVLCGDVDASGRLPTTIPHRLEDTPAFTSYPGENGVVRYGEGVFVGYRWYDARKVEPLYPFGHGLSYATYAYGPVSAELVGDNVVVTVPVSNTSARDGREVVQVYVSDLESRLSRPPQELKGFVKIDVPAGTTVTASIRLGTDAFRYFDPGNGGWTVELGDFEIRVGRSSRDIRGTAIVRWGDAGDEGGPSRGKDA